MGMFLIVLLRWPEAQAAAGHKMKDLGQSLLEKTFEVPGLGAITLMVVDGPSFGQAQALEGSAAVTQGGSGPSKVGRGIL